ncbi:MAG: C4-type zinc ribbon domain-containing protein [bacterium]|jgi:hypothetical protein|nr:C4-type zinc ribbon domain-containing protein [bacterium]
MELMLLIELQKIDNQFRDVEISKGTLPQELERLQQEERDLSVMREQSQVRLKELELDLRKRERRHDELKLKVAELQKRLFSTQTNQEYEAVTREIEFHQDALMENEQAMQTAMEQQEELESKLGESAERAIRLTESLGRMRGQFAEHTTASATRIGELDAHRAELCTRIPKPLLSHYDRIRKAKDGRGVVSVYRSSSCGGCFQALPPQKINKVRQMDDLVLCEICGRILISDTLDAKL